MTLDFTTPHVLRDEREYEAALSEIERLLDAGQVTSLRELLGIPADVLLGLGA